MRSSCINHPSREPLLILRQWQVEACDGNHCAAALLSFLEYWHNIRLEQAVKAAQANDVAERHGDERTQNESLVQWHNSAELEDGLLGLFARGKIAESIVLLESKGFIRVSRNPNPRYKFDATKHFVFEDGAVNEWIAARVSRLLENRQSDVGKAATVVENRTTVAEKAPLTVETTPEATSKVTEIRCADAPSVPTKPASLEARTPNAASEELPGVNQPPKPSKARKRQPAATGEAHKRFIALWVDEFQRSTGFRYQICGGKDGAAVSRLVSNGETPEQLIELARFAWGPGNLRDFHRDRARSITGFAASLPVIQAAYASAHPRALTEAEKAANIASGDEWQNEAQW